MWLSFEFSTFSSISQHSSFITQQQVVMKVSFIFFVSIICTVMQCSTTFIYPNYSYNSNGIGNTIFIYLFITDANLLWVGHEETKESEKSETEINRKWLEMISCQQGTTIMCQLLWLIEIATRDNLQKNMARFFLLLS